MKLECSFERKDLARAIGARWSPALRSWEVSDVHDNEGFYSLWTRITQIIRVYSYDHNGVRYYLSHYDHKDYLKRNFPGARWDVQNKVWFENLETPPSKPESKNDNETIELNCPPLNETNVEHSDTGAACASVKATPYAFQRENVSEIFKHKHFLVADEMGLGKSLTAIIAVNFLDKPALIICPASLKRNWENEFKKFTDKKAFVVRSKKDIPEALKHQIAIVNYDILTECEALFNRDVIVCDESHYAKSFAAQRTKALHNHLQTFKPEYLILLSGTPIKNRIPEFFSPLCLLSKTNAPNGKKIFNYFKKQQDFCENFAFPIRSFIRGRVITKWVGLKNEDQLNELKEGKYLRHEVKDNLNLPPLIESQILVDVSQGVADLEEELLAVWEMAEEGKKSEHLARVKKSAATIKAPSTAKYCANILEQDEGPLVIFSDHVEATEMIFEAMKKDWRGAIITGATNMDERQKIVDEFQAGNLDFLAATIGSTKEGLTLTAAHHCIFNDPAWVPADMEQAKKRIHRIGQNLTSFVHYLCFGDTDKMIYNTLKSKLEVLRRAL